MTDLLTITETAATKIRSILDNRGKPSAGLRLGTGVAGCSGLTYEVDYVDEPKDTDTRIDAGGVTLFIDTESLAYLKGAEMDYAEDTFTSGFTFTNPNAKSVCGCGESFSV